ncbi:carboxypeptidase-like regulatory domain-containing protein [Serpentinicella sp. ANB-PHB4]|uniref:carboxypeptidase-like regulatory domain-containing protein n=1 Tax=Serpentinicella sp. ANB-PHB4 TaxID=3074076 RepID=UPI0028654C2B|nr:carboxypeptidase-like regulatory domain-containing protein [Serpentinicella sp. ANB-PHB4]MDR5659268.1 carboxypeptidase-like regulatory domain-containing protein [Serpentinicella sp. ANB-PHB4]
MKKKIRIKVKHLLGFVGISLACLLLTYVFLPFAMFAIAERHEYKGNTIAATVYYDRMNQYFPNHGKTAQALERAAQLTTTKNLLIISSVGYGPGNALLSQGLISEKSVPYYEALAERFPNTFEGNRAMTQLALHQIRREINDNNVEAAYSLMENHYEYLSDDSTAYNDPTLLLESVTFLKGKGFYEEAIKFLSFYVENDSQNVKIYETLGDLYAIVNHEEKALHYYTEAINALEEIREFDTHYIGQEDGTTKRYTEVELEKIYDKIENLSDTQLYNGSITGQITLREDVFKGVNVFLQPQKHQNMRIFTPVSGENLWSISDDHGKFSFNNLPPGRYSLGFVLDVPEVGDVVLKGGLLPGPDIEVKENENQHLAFELVDTITPLSPLNNKKITGDSIHFSWEPFEDAAYYTLELGTYSKNGTYSRRYSDYKFFTNEATLTIEELTTLSSSIMAFEEDGPDPDLFLGFTHPKGKYFWGIAAHDEDGHILSSSLGYMKSQNTDFHFEDRALRMGDQYILQKKFLKAIEAYESDLSENPNDVYALTQLAKLYGFTYGDEDLYPYADLNKAIKYYERLYEITKNPALLYIIEDLKKQS